MMVTTKIELTGADTKSRHNQRQIQTRPLCFEDGITRTISFPAHVWAVLDHLTGEKGYALWTVLHEAFDLTHELLREGFTTDFESELRRSLRGILMAAAFDHQETERPSANDCEFQTARDLWA